MWTVELAQPGRMGELMAVSSMFLVDRRLVVEGGKVVGQKAVDPPYVKDYDAFPGDQVADWPRVFEVATWGLFLARSPQGDLVGGAVVAAQDKSVNLLESRDDLAHVFDIRVHPDHQGQGLGRRLWEEACHWCTTRGITELRVETQDVNVAACAFYAAMGCHIHKVDRHAYPVEMGETQVIWSLSLAK